MLIVLPMVLPMKNTNCTANGTAEMENNTVGNNKKHSYKSLTPSTGARYYQVYANNDYKGTVDATTCNERGARGTFAELERGYNKLNYSVGGYGAYMWTGQAGANYHKFQGLSKI